MKVFKEWKSILAILLIATMMVPATALAAGKIDLDRPVSLTLSCKTDNGTPLSGQPYDIYQIADVDAYGELTVLEAFESFDVNIRGKNDEAWRTLASTLEGYVKQSVYQGNLKSTDSGKTDEQGNLTFPTSASNPLKPGLYLVMGHYFIQGSFHYEPEPFLIMLPGIDMEKNQWVYDAFAKPKQESGMVVFPPSYISRKVLKVWDDSGKEDLRPKSVTVHLLQDGKVYDTVQLSASNNWRWSWDELSDGYSWNVVEEVSGDYSVGITQEGITFVVKNTYIEEPEEPEEPVTPENPDKPGKPDDSLNVDDPNTPTGSNDLKDPNGPKLPQTGMLWWPVPAMAALGLLFLAAGILYRRKESAEEERP